MASEYVRRSGAGARSRAGRARSGGGRWADSDDRELSYPDERNGVQQVELRLVRMFRRDDDFYEIHFIDHDGRAMEVDPGIAATLGRTTITRKIRSMFPNAEIVWLE